MGYDIAVLAIVIITRNTKELVAGLLSSIETDAAIRAAATEVVLVDNGSTDGTEAMVASRFPWVTYAGSPNNMGFAAAANMGYRRCSAEFVLFLNSDTRLIEGETSRMLAFMEREPSVGIVAPQLVYEDMRPQRSFAHAPTLAAEIVPGALLRTFGARLDPKGDGSTTPRDVPSVIGAAMMTRRKVLDLLGGFDERFFFFLEETDFCLRTGRSGMRVVFFPASRLIHFQGKTVSRSWVEGRIEYVISLYKFIGKYHSRAYRAAFGLVRVAKALLFVAPVTLLPFMLAGTSIRRRYRYYARFLLWHLHGCPDDAGLRSSRGAL
jgi:GT2 family glycosyltransferase